MAADFLEEARRHAASLARMRVAKAQDISDGAILAFDIRNYDAATIVAKMMNEDDGVSVDDTWESLKATVAGGNMLDRIPVHARWCSIESLRKLMKRQATNHKFDEWLIDAPPLGHVRLLLMSRDAYVSFEVLPFDAASA